MTATRPARSGAHPDDNPTFQDRIRRVVPYALILAVGLYFLHVTGSFEYDQTAGSLGPAAWPRLVLLLMTGACGFEILRVMLLWKGDRRTQVVEHDVVPDLDEGDAGLDNLAQAAAALGSIVAYLLALPYLGFFTATVVFIWIFALVAGYRRLVIMTVVTLGLTLTFMFLFMRVIYVSLPIGVEPFTQISIWIMKLLGVA